MANVKKPKRKRPLSPLVSHLVAKQQFKQVFNPGEKFENRKEYNKACDQAFQEEIKLSRQE